MLDDQSDGAPGTQNHDFPSVQERKSGKCPRRKLRKIFERALKNLITETRSDEPKSVCRNAKDLLRKIPDWLDFVANLVLTGVHATEFENEEDACRTVLAHAEAVHNELDRLIKNGVKSDPVAEELWKSLKSALRAAREGILQTSQFGTEEDLPALGKETVLPFAPSKPVSFTIQEDRDGHAE
jgi:hypothetical protein